MNTGRKASSRPTPWNADYGVVGSIHCCLAFSCQLSASGRPLTPHPSHYLTRSDSSIFILPLSAAEGVALMSVVHWFTKGSRAMRCLAVFIGVNIAYSATKLVISLVTSCVGASWNKA